MDPPTDRRLFLNLSNRIEVLASQLAADLSSNPGDPMEPRTVMVHSSVTARWLSMQLASQSGIAMGVDYTFPRAIIDELIAEVLPGACASQRFTHESMTWWIFDHLPHYLHRSDFSMVSEYLKDGDQVKRHQLARRAAWLLHQYQIYRPDMLVNWETSKGGSGWQQHLWLELRRECQDELSFVDLLKKVTHLKDHEVAESKLPEHLSIFGLNTLPPSFLQILWKLSPVTQVDFYLLSPTDQYWGDLLSKKKLAQVADPDAFTEGNPLLTSMGRLSQDLLNQLVDLDFQQAFESFDPISSGRMISSIQDDLQSLLDRTQSDEKFEVLSDDSSILINACHSPMREVEVLHDHLLALFQEDETLRPRDVLVMAPDIEVYAPFIQAVFGSPESDELWIPYSLADQRPRSEYAVVDSFFRVLELGVSRFEVEVVMGTLECEPIRRRFSLSETDLERIRKWIRECGVVWAIDPEHRLRMGFEADSAYTWAQGRATLLEGYAMNGKGPRLFGGTLPYEDMEGDHTKTLGRFLEAFNLFSDVAALLCDARTRSEWVDVLQPLASRLFSEDSVFAVELGSIQNALNSLREDGAEEEGEIVDPEVIILSLNQSLNEVTTSGGFLDGRVTFCSMKPMRALPSPVICLLGMNDTDFPRLPKQQAFDLMAADPKPGDRSSREDDRHLFLETLMGVRSQLYISYVGLSARDLTEAPPSVVVCELLDYLNRGFQLPETVRHQLDYRHRLQAFSQTYFQPGTKQSFSRENAEAAHNLRENANPRSPYFSKGLPKPEQELRTVGISLLERFFVNPAKALCETRLGMRLEVSDEVLPAFEPIEMNSLDRYKIQQKLVDLILRGKADQRNPIWEAAQARGQIPAGPLGRIAKTDVNNAIKGFVSVVKNRLDIEEVETVAVKKRIGLFELVGEIEGIYSGTLGRFRCASLKSSDLVRSWILHVLLNLEKPGSITIILDRDGKELNLSAPKDPDKIAKVLLDLYWKGLQEPLPFFPQSSLEYTAYSTGWKNMREGSAPPLQRARAKWFGNRFNNIPGEGDDPYLRLVFGEEPPFDTSFESVSLAFFEPLLDCLEPKEGKLLP